MSSDNIFALVSFSLRTVVSSGNIFAVPSARLKGCEKWKSSIAVGSRISKSNKKDREDSPDVSDSDEEV
jgi:hypothetical protein